MPISEFLKKLRSNTPACYLGGVIAAILLLGIYAPLFASSKPLFVYQNLSWRFPLFESLFYRGFFTQKLDLFFNILMAFLPLSLIGFYWIKKKRGLALFLLILMQLSLFYYYSNKPLKSLEFSSKQLQAENIEAPSFVLKPLLVQKHWQENAIDPTAGAPFSTARVNGKNLWSSLLFGIRYSMAIALASTFLAFLLGTFIGAIAGYFGKSIDLILGRLIEVWESMPTLFVLLLIISLSKSQSIGLIIITLALFSWTSIARIVRLEVLKQKPLAYVEVLKGFGFGHRSILVKHILPGAFSTLLTLIPFALIGAITYEAALSFLGMGNRQSCSIGLLLDEARMSYPMDPSLFWPPALLLMTLLICLAWIGDIAKKIIEHKESVI